MVRYLSDEWIAAADDAVRSDANSAPAGRIVVDQYIDDVASYRIRIDRGDCAIVSLRNGDDGHRGSDGHDADVVFRQSAETARAVAMGETDAHQAFLLGQIRFEGNIDLLIRRRDAFDWLASRLAPVIASTEF